MKIAVIGTGNIGGTLGRRWAQAGHEVVYGSRTPGSDGPGGAPVASATDAVDGADAVLLAVPAKAVADLLDQIGASLAGKTVVDATNNFGGSPVNAHSLVAEKASGAAYVRAFSTLGWENFAEPPADADLFFAADAGARATSEQLISAVGLRPVFVGDASAAGTVDALLPLWIALVQQSGGERRLALRVVR